MIVMVAVTATDASTASALAPGYRAFTCTCGGVMLGNSSIGKELIASSPARVMMMLMTKANFGRSMKNNENMFNPRFLRREFHCSQ